jgi:hypothetical protein
MVPFIGYAGMRIVPFCPTVSIKASTTVSAPPST